MAWKLPSVAAAAFALALCAAPATAGELEAPKGEIILTIDGSIGKTNTAAGAEFDMAMLEGLPKAMIKTATPWTKGVATFEGVLLSDLLALVEPKGDTITASALNDYAAPVPTADAATGAIIAYRMNGEFMPVCNKGPLWIVYPLDEKPELKAETIYARSVWQLRKMTLSK